mmetsp:Transcript_18980/g.62814  ORF Transcript_18980/g.62814 Transcript_18980/m.62814 type:complete len:304 (+) Transcript_18980:247-1158(+)
MGHGHRPEHAIQHRERSSNARVPAQTPPRSPELLGDGGGLLERRRLVSPRHGGLPLQVADRAVLRGGVDLLQRRPRRDKHEAAPVRAGAHHLQHKHAQVVERERVGQRLGCAAGDAPARGEVLAPEKDGRDGRRLELLHQKDGESARASVERRGRPLRQRAEHVPHGAQHCARGLQPERHRRQPGAPALAHRERGAERRRPEAELAARLPRRHDCQRDAGVVRVGVPAQAGLAALARCGHDVSGLVVHNLEGGDRVELLDNLLHLERAGVVLSIGGSLVRLTIRHPAGVLLLSILHPRRSRHA